jgi:hypothetical protein
LLFNPEDEVTTFIRNAGKLLSDSTTPQIIIAFFSQHREKPQISINQQVSQLMDEGKLYVAWIYVKTHAYTEWMPRCQFYYP